MIQFTGVQVSRLREEKLSNGNLFAEFAIGPVPQGYGYTLANSLRRVLLSSITGYSITSVRINDLTHEFTTIPGVKQNVLDIVLRLKNLRFRVSGSEDMYVLNLNIANRQGDVTGKDLNVPSDVEVVNKDYVIASLGDKTAVLNMEAVLEKGIGYRTPDDSLRDEIGRIPVDAVFSPVKLVSFEVTPSRKGGRADFDKIILKVTTDGSVNPEEALVEAISILDKFYTVLRETPITIGARDEGEDDASVAESLEEKEATEKAKQEEKSKPEKKTLADLEITDSIQEKLKKASIKSLEDLVDKTKDEILEINGIGAKAVESIEKALSKLGLKLK